jgi:hypothetical protein
MDVRGSLATASVILGAMSACAAQPGEEGPGEPLDVSEPLDLTVDSVDIVHGALRVTATMVGGSADVSVRLGGDCDHREVGGGLSTLSTLVWALGDKDVAEAIRCGLVVRARVREGTRYVKKLAELAVTVDVAAQDPENTEGAPQLQSVTTSDTGVVVVFAPVPRGARLKTADSILEAAPPEPDESVPTDGDDTGRFTVARADFARCVLGGRALTIDGASFATSVSVGGTSLEVEARDMTDTLLGDRYSR